MNDVTQSQEQWEQEWARMLELAKTRPAMFIGTTSQGHRLPVSAALRLLWQARVFRRPVGMAIDLTPHQCVVRCHAGPLLNSIQQIFSWGGERALAEPVRVDGKTYFERLTEEDEAQGKPFSKYRCRRGWRYCFSGPVGPRLTEPSYPALLARRFLWGVRTDAGLWCQAYTSGWPTGAPFLVADRSPVALIVVADLDPQWFVGLPYGAEEVETWSKMAHRKIRMTPYERPLPDWTPGDVSVKWHPHDDLVTDASLTPAGVKVWL